MIKPKDVITIKIPYPSINSALALKSHMYICKEKIGSHCELIKCQTLKPAMLLSNKFKHFVDEAVDISRNPFIGQTRIDCDKLFITDSVRYDAKLKTTNRPDVSNELFYEVIAELNADGYKTIHLNEQELTNINIYITKI